jgi:hypothetical protein
MMTIKISGSECHKQVALMQRGPSEQQNNDNAAACLYFLNDHAFLRPAADRAISILLWAVSISQKKKKKK